MAMYTRELGVPKRSFFLLGPRGTGKTTWLRQKLPEATWYNLLHGQELVRLTRDRTAFRQEVSVLPDGAWVVIDEVQRAPDLLNDVHDVLSKSNTGAINFALTGSSARKLRSVDANLLAGRALSRRFFPLTRSELQSAFDVDRVLSHGSLPEVYQEPDSEVRGSLLEAYVETYLLQEIRAEALAKDLGAFSRYLEVAALSNGQVVNMAGLARNAGVARPTVQGYFEVLVDTLLGSFLPAFQPRVRVKETAHPKFYMFDTGVLRALTRRQNVPLSTEERGALLETYLHHELRAHIHYHGTGGTLSYWRTPNKVEVDFVYQTHRGPVAIECKATDRLRSEDMKGLETFTEQFGCRGYGVYLGQRPRLVSERIEFLPLELFLSRMSEILGS